VSEGTSILIFFPKGKRSETGAIGDFPAWRRHLLASPAEYSGRCRVRVERGGTGFLRVGWTMGAARAGAGKIRRAPLQLRGDDYAGLARQVETGGKGALAGQGVSTSTGLSPWLWPHQQASARSRNARFTDALSGEEIREIRLDQDQVRSQQLACL